MFEFASDVIEVDGTGAVMIQDYRRFRIRLPAIGKIRNTKEH